MKREGSKTLQNIENASIYKCSPTKAALIFQDSFDFDEHILNSQSMLKINPSWIQRMKLYIESIHSLKKKKLQYICFKVGTYLLL